MVTKPTDFDPSVRQFLKTGSLGGASVAEVASACDRLVRSETERSAPSAVRFGEQFVRQARKHSREMLPTALRALGWAYVVAGKYPEAARNYLEARHISRDPIIRARIDRILIDVYMYLGRHGEAAKRGRLALATFRRHGAEADTAKTEVNYANVLHRLDRHPEALQLYRRAGTFFSGQGNELAAAFCWYNEANTLVQLFHFAPAEQLYTSAREIFSRHDHTLRAIGCLYGLAWLHMLEGRFHVALQELAECEDHYLGAGQRREHLLCVLDRAETYLSLNLLPDARDTARRAARHARALGLRYEGAKASFFLGKALLALGQARSGQTALRKAAEGFRREGNVGFLAAVRVAEAMTRHFGAARTRALVKVRNRLPGGRLPLWEALCDLEILAAEPGQIDAPRRLSVNRAVKVMPHVRAQYVTLLGDRDARQGRHTAAVRRWRQAADILTAIRSQLPPIDIRAAFSERHSGPYEKLIAAECERHPRRAAAWLERYRTAGIWATQDTRLEHSARAQAEQSLADLAISVAAAALRPGGEPVRQAVGNGPTPVQRRIEERVRTSLTRLESGRSSVGERLSAIGTDIARLSHTFHVVQFHSAGEGALAFVHEDGASRTSRLSDTIGPILQRWRFFVERAPYRDTVDTEADLDDERRLLTRLADLLWQPLDLDGRKPVLIIADGPLANLPWAGLLVGGHPLLERHLIVMAPSVRHHLMAAGHHSTSTEAHVFVGAGDGLRSSDKEYGPLVSGRTASAIIHDPCKRADWPDGSQADVWHFTGHAHFRTDNPFYSYLQLADGPLFAADFRLRRNVVNLVVLAACRTGLYSLLPGDESTGLIRALLEMGARNVVASHWAVADESTACWIHSFYDALSSGQAPAAAVRSAARANRERFPSAYDWAGFSLFGAG